MIDEEILETPIGKDEKDRRRRNRERKLREKRKRYNGEDDYEDHTYRRRKQKR